MGARIGRAGRIGVFDTEGGGPSERAGGSPAPPSGVVMVIGGRTLQKTTFAACFRRDASYAYGWSCDVCAKNKADEAVIWHGLPRPGESSHGP